MKLHLVRHGVTAETGSRLTGRLPGVPLSEAGRKQAESTGRYLASGRIASIVTSPVQRCHETASSIATIVGARTRRDKRLEEVDYGTWQGRSLNSLRKLKAWQSLFIAPERFRFPGGETLAEAQHRAVTAVEDLAVQHRSVTVVIVSHADVIRVVLAHYLGMPLAMVHRLDVRPASVSTVLLHPGKFPIVPVVNHVEAAP